MHFSWKPSLCHISFSWYRRGKTGTEHGVSHPFWRNLPAQKLRRLPRPQGPLGPPGTGSGRTLSSSIWRWYGQDRVPGCNGQSLWLSAQALCCQWDAGSPIPGVRNLLSPKNALTQRHMAVREAQ